MMEEIKLAGAGREFHAEALIANCGAQAEEHI